MTPEEILRRLEAYFQIQVENLNDDEMAEGPFEDDDDVEYGVLWQEAAEVIDRNGGLIVKFEFREGN